MSESFGDRLGSIGDMAWNEGAALEWEVGWLERLGRELDSLEASGDGDGRGVVDALVEYRRYEAATARWGLAVEGALGGSGGEWYRIHAGGVEPYLEGSDAG